MTELGPAEVGRLARLARLELSEGEAAALAPQLAAIAREFEGLRDLARTLAPGDEPAAGALREDVAEPDARADALLAQVPRLDAATRKVRVERA